jgi:hypothetical protein
MWRFRLPTSNIYGCKNNLFLMQFQVGQFGAKKVDLFAPKSMDQVRTNLVDQYRRFFHQDR